jgi:two-component system, OmpR family, phosphate regulon sensor histidine kinase PhoR
MIAAILVIACFQAYWLKQLYNDEFKNLKTQTDVLLKQSVQEIQNKKLKSDSAFLAFIAKSSTDSSSNKVKEVNTSAIPNKATNYQKTKASSNINKASTALKTVDSFVSKNKITAINFSAETLKTKPFIAISNTYDGTIINVDSVLNKIDPSSIRSIHVYKDSSISASTHPFAIQNLSIKKGTQKDSLIRSVSLLKTMNAITKDTVLSKGNNVLRITTKFNMDSSRAIKFNGFFIKLLTDTIPVQKIDSAFKRQLQKDKVNIPFALVVKSKEDAKNSIVTENKLATNFVSSGLVEPVMYKAEFKNPFKYIARKMAIPILLSIFLLGFVSAAFIFLYNNMKTQYKLANMKNEFISNITHELKTPISTVSVAVEAMRNFNALNNAQKTKEYLDISASEITRLSLLVDNVLKLSMFENDKIELDKQHFDVVQLINEILNALSIQFEQHQAIIEFQPSLEKIIIHADRLHLSSVLFNLLDNAIKYSKQQPTIFVTTKQFDGYVEIRVKDEGIGIDKEYHNKIFNKFFRVSQGVDKHNVKGYGLGLSYVYYIIKKHNGHINIESEKNKGTTFIINIPT